MSVCAKAKLLPPSAIPDDFIGNEFRNTAIAFAVVETCMVALRYYARYLGKAPLGADDFLLPFALLFSYGQEAIGIAMVERGGVGHRAVWNCIHQPWVFPIFAKLQISNILTLAIAIALAKITILNLFLRIFVQRLFRIATYVVIGIQIASMLTVVIVGVTQCTPLAFIWEPQKHPNGHCIDKNTFWRWGNFPQIVTDVCILVLPIPALWQLKLSKRDKFGVILTFCTGGIGLITSIVRFYMFYKIDGQADAGWQAVPLGSISIAETGAYVIAACLPIYRSLFRRAVGHLGTTFGSGGSKGPQYGSNKSTELRSLGKSEKGFARIQHDEVGSGTFTKSRGSDTSEERLTYPSGHTEIQIQRSYVVSSQQV